MLRVLARSTRVLMLAAALGVSAFAVSCGNGESDSSQTSRTGELSITDIAVNNVQSDGFVLSWRTGQPSDGSISYGTSRDNLNETIPVRALTTFHRTTVQNLTPATTYYYRITARVRGGGEVQSPIAEVATPEPPSAPAAPADGYDVAVITTDMGVIELRFLETIAPGHAANFKRLAREGFYDGTTFHRVIPGFMIQGGDPYSKDDFRGNDGTGGPGYTIPAEISARHRRGSVAAARTGDQVNPERRSSGSQFYICVVPTPFLDGQYTVFAHVISGMEVADRIVQVPRDERDNPLSPVIMRSVRIEHRQ